MTIVQASIEALRILNKASSIEEIRMIIDQEKLYNFGAAEENINSTIRNNIERCSKNTNRSKTQKDKYFIRTKPNTYILIEWEIDNMNNLNTIKNYLEGFKKNWLDDKTKITNTISSNKIYNEELKKTLSDKDFKKNRKSIKFTEFTIHKIFCQDLPSLIIKKSFLPDSKYKIEGSIGQGGIAEIPWICVYDKEITTKATEGYFIVFLIKADLSGFYLSLNQGWTQYENNYGIKEARIQIKENSIKALKLLKSLEGFNTDSIELLSSRPLGKGYELGNICSKYYSFDNMPNDNILIDDLRNLIGSYKELKGYIGLDILDLKNQLSEVEYQEKTQNAKRKNLDNGPIERKNKTNSINSSSWSRDPDIAFTALENATFLCENDHSHSTFISEKTGQQFVEAHHLIPMQYQNEYSMSIDVPENIISLCPNCHRAFHNSEKKLKKELIAKFFNLRANSLLNRDIEIDIDNLNRFYG